jgi:hypothetical protein
MTYTPSAQLAIRSMQDAIHTGKLNKKAIDQIAKANELFRKEMGREVTAREVIEFIGVKGI